MDQELIKVYGNKVRIRACGLCWQGDLLLVADHKHLGQEHFWAPPGGGINFGETAKEALKREFLEETGLTIAVGDFLFACEFIDPPLHAIELFFEVRATSGTLTKGSDPETRLDVIGHVEYKTLQSLAELPVHQKHGIFNFEGVPSNLRNLRGYIQLL